MEVKFTCKSDNVVHSFGILDECQCGNHPKKQKQICFKERPRWQLKTFFTNQSKLCIEEFYNGNWQSFTYLILRRSVRKGHFSALILQNFVSMCLGARRARCLSTILHLRKDITNYVLQKIFTKMIFKLC